MEHKQANKKGLAVLVGAGPGQLGLLTLEGEKWLELADVVIYDRLVNPAMLDCCQGQAEKIFVGKAPGAPRYAQDDINSLLVEKTQAGLVVVRLKGGDPLIFGRGGEEVQALIEAQCEFRIVPGISAGVAAGALAGISLTDRRYSSTLAFVTAHEDPAKTETAIDFAALARIGTVVFYMGVGCIDELTKKMIDAGRAGECPAAIVQDVSLPTQRTIVATLETLPSRAREAGVQAPAVIIIGQAVLTHEQMGWFEQLPMFGQTVIVTRSRPQASKLAEGLADLGANVIETPTIEIAPMENDHEFLEFLEDLEATPFDWVVFTSPNGVSEFVRQCARHGRDSRCLKSALIAAVGPATAEALTQKFLQPDIVPEEFTTESLGKALINFGQLSGKRVLLVRSNIAPPLLADMLTQAGATVEELAVYRTLCPASLSAQADEALQTGQADWITFTSSSTVENFITLAGLSVLEDVKLAAIGPVTAQTLRKHGLVPTVEAYPHTIDALINAMLKSP